MVLTKDENTIILIASLIYHIWFARNKMIFEGKFVPEEDICR